MSGIMVPLYEIKTILIKRYFYLICKWPLLQESLNMSINTTTLSYLIYFKIS